MLACSSFFRSRTRQSVACLLASSLVPARSCTVGELTTSRVPKIGDWWRETLGPAVKLLLDAGSHRTLAAELLASGMTAGAAVESALSTGDDLGTWASGRLRNERGRARVRDLGTAHFD